ncbi:MAG: hypothetical protein M1829_000096 [Trizodia sp. TS-e1964]|nr:MAG: hypothetical protein M1829_000096 [Trizodia sp. TS-e1964]
MSLLPLFLLFIALRTTALAGRAPQSHPLPNPLRCSGHLNIVQEVEDSNGIARAITIGCVSWKGKAIVKDPREKNPLARCGNFYAGYLAGVFVLEVASYVREDGEEQRTFCYLDYQMILNCDLGYQPVTSGLASSPIADWVHQGLRRFGGFRYYKPLESGRLVSEHSHWWQMESLTTQGRQKLGSLSEKEDEQDLSMRPKEDTGVYYIACAKEEPQSGWLDKPLMRLRVVREWLVN